VILCDDQGLNRRCAKSKYELDESPGKIFSRHNTLERVSRFLRVRTHDEKSPIYFRHNTLERVSQILRVRVHDGTRPMCLAGKSTTCEEKSLLEKRACRQDFPPKRHYI